MGINDNPYVIREAVRSNIITKYGLLCLISSWIFVILFILAGASELVYDLLRTDKGSWSG